MLTVDSSCVQPAARYTGRTEYFGAVFFDHATGEVLPFDAVGAALIAALSTYPPEDVVRAFSSEVNGGEPAVRAFLDEWTRRGLLNADMRPQVHMLAERTCDGFLSAPLRMYVDFTAACNLQCPHCVTRSGRRRPEELDTAEWYEVLERIAAAGVFEINVGGGEPLLRPDAIDILARAGALGMSVALTTNGTRIDADMADRLGTTRLRYVAVSLDGASAATHDAIRGPGNFERTLQGVRHLCERTSLHVNLHFTVMRHNLGELEDFFRLAETVPAHSLGVLPIRPSGRAIDHADLHLSVEEYREVAGRLEALSQSSVKPVFHIPFMPGNDDHGSSRMYSVFGCGAAQVTCYMDACGGVVPCNFFEDPGPRESLLEKDLLLIWREGPFFVRLRNLHGNPKCLGCRHLGACRGGCRAQAASATGDLNAPDSYCLG